MSFFQKLLLFVGLPLYVLDQATKWWIVLHFAPPWSADRHEQPVIEGYFNLVRVHNQGVAFGLGNGTSWAPVVFLLVPVIAVTMIRVFWKKGVFATKLSQIAAALLLTGIFGNLTDRLTQGFFLEELSGGTFWQRLAAGYVVDFLDFTIPLVNYRWPSFNVADSCICIAAGLLFISGLREPKKA
jgi:signal peptidase II